MPADQSNDCPQQTFAVVGRYLKQVIPILGIDPPMLLRIVQARSPEEAFRRFIAQEAANLKDAQRFYDLVKVYPVADKAHQYRLSDRYGRWAKYPDPDMLKL